MKNITLAVDDEMLDKVRTYAAAQKATVNAIVRQHLEKTANGNGQRADARRTSVSACLLRFCRNSSSFRKGATRGGPHRSLSPNPQQPSGWVGLSLFVKARLTHRSFSRPSRPRENTAF